MKRFGLTWVLLMVWLAGHGQSLALSSLDTLMQTRPDSALTVLVEGYERFDTLAVDRHYYHLLLSEALYKNDYAQTDREALLDAMAYYDSLCEGKSARRNASIPYLAARCHYMNGVGYYEMDSVVLACTEYFKALELMEEHYSERKLVGEKAKFMALINSRLFELFSDQYLHEQAIYFGKQSLNYYVLSGASPWHIACVEKWIGSQFQMLDQLDSADYYYQKALEILLDTNCLAYRDIRAVQVLLLFQQEEDGQTLLLMFHNLLAQAESDKEYLARCLPIGHIYYSEKMYDSAWNYLNRVFLESQDVASRMQAAEWLVEICKLRGMDAELLDYTEFLVPFATLEKNESDVKSRLTKVFGDYVKQKQETLNQHEKKQLIFWILLGLCGVVLVITISLYPSIKRKREQHKQMSEKLLMYQTERKALYGKLKKNNQNTRRLKEQEKQLEDILYSDVSNKASSFSEEPICKYLLTVCNDPQYQIKSSMAISAYANIALSNEQKAQLKQAVLWHYGLLFETLKMNYPKLKEKDLTYCYLCLLGLNNTQISVLLQKSYSAIWDTEKKLQKIFQREEAIVVILNGFLIENQVINKNSEKTEKLLS